MKNGTSIKEQSLLFFIRKFYPSAESRKQIMFNGKKYEADIFIPELGLVIEYDGSYWHRKKAQKDNEKNAAFNAAGYEVLHIREYGLPELDEFNGTTINLPRYELNEVSFDYVNLVLEFLRGKSTKELAAEISKFTVGDEAYNSSLKYIYSELYSEPIEANLLDMCGSEYWDYEANLPLVIEHVNDNEWVPATLTCAEGKTIPLPRYKRDYKSSCKSAGDECDSCLSHIMCPFMRWCHKTDDKLVACNHIERIVWDMVKRGDSIKKYNRKVLFVEWLSNESDISAKLIEAYNNPLTDETVKKNIAVFLGAEEEMYEMAVQNNCFDIADYFNPDVRSFWNGVPDKNHAVSDLYFKCKYSK